MSKLTFDTVAKEICKREKSELREVNITDVKRVMRHLFDLLAEHESAWFFDGGEHPYEFVRRELAKHKSKPELHDREGEVGG